VSVVEVDLPDATQTRYNTGTFGSEHGGELVESKGQFTILVLSRCVDQRMMRTVRWPQHQLVVAHALAGNMS
jgi:hypothetical protein